MEPATKVIAPIRSFSGMSRLSESLSSGQRGDLSRVLAQRLVDAVDAIGLEVVVVTSDHDVVTWAQPNATIIDDPGRGLSAAAEAGVAECADRWLVIHADLPLVDAEAIRSARDAVTDGMIVLVPSPDGGTTVIGGSGPFPFSFGPGSFHRHLASAPTARILTDRRLAVDLDTPAQWKALRARIEGP